MKKILLSLMMLCSVSAAWAQDDGFVTVASASQMYNVLSGNAHAKVRLTADIYLSDLGADFEDTFCSTFYGILDGDGHAIKGDHYADNTTQRRNRTYLFTYSDGATFRNLTFKHINKSSTVHSNQCILTSQAKNNCVFENITFDNCGASSDVINVGAAVGLAENCTFTNITVKNSDFTVKGMQTGAVVGLAENCTFTNIKVENCEFTAKNGESGGVAGSARNCKFNNVEVLGISIKTNGTSIGGVVGGSYCSDYTNCIVDDQSCICADGEWFVGDGIWAEVGGIVGDLHECSFTNCINSALVAADGQYIGGIAGRVTGSSSFEDCLNTGMVISMDLDDVESFYNKYKTKSGLTCVTKTYKGKEYVIRKYEAVCSDNHLGGIIGAAISGDCTISTCANLGSVYSTDDDYVGGIAGYLNHATVKNCLSDFHGSSGAHGICGAIGDGNGGECFIDSCLNMTTYKDFSAYENNWVGFKSDEKNYSLTTAEDADHTNKTTVAKIKSGEICHLLGEAWEQNLGTDPYPTPTGNKGLYHTRKVSNQYGTVCLPFPVKSDDKISYYRLTRKEEDGQDIKLVFKYVETVNAGWPVLYRAAEDATADNPVEISFNNAGDDFASVSLGNIGGYWELYGTFEQKVFDETTSPSSKNIYYVSGGEIRNAKKTTVAPYRAWIYGPSIDTLTGNASQAKAIRFVIEDEDGETTALELVGDDFMPVQQSGKSYSLMGTEVSNGYRGLVIRNGKIMIQKR